MGKTELWCKHGQILSYKNKIMNNLLMVKVTLFRCINFYIWNVSVLSNYAAANTWPHHDPVCLYLCVWAACWLHAGIFITVVTRNERRKGRAGVSPYKNVCVLKAACFTDFKYIEWILWKKTLKPFRLLPSLLHVWPFTTTHSGHVNVF